MKGNASQSRREFLARLTGSSLALGRSLSAINAAGRSQVAALPAGIALPTTAQRGWQDLEIGLFIHFAPNTWQEQEYDDRSTPLSALNPDIDTDQWADVAVALGARYIVFVAKHTGGFCMWQTTSSDYSLRSTPWRGGKGDVVADLAESCRKRNLRLGVYLSPRDDHFGAGLSGKCESVEKQLVYNGVARQQLTELLTRYGSMVEIWFDGSSVVPVDDILSAHARDSMIFQGPRATIRWVGNEHGFAPYPAWNALDIDDARTGVATALHGDPLGRAWMPLEVDVSIRRPNWFWSTTNHANLLTLEALVEIYYRSVGRGAQLLLNMPPDRTGHIPAADAARAREFGDEIRRRFGRSLAESSGVGEQVDVPLSAPAMVDHVIVEEDLQHGERVRGYRLEGLDGGRWTPIGTGLSIGHKRIHPFQVRSLGAVRLVCTECASTPHIRRLAAFQVGTSPPVTWNDTADIWADDAVGRWTDGRVDVDLAKKIEKAGTYRLRFVPVEAASVDVQDLQLTLGGAPAPQSLRRIEGRTDAWMIRIAQAGQPATLQGRVRNARRGSVLLRAL